MSDGVNIFVCGRTQSGKSYLLKSLVASCPRLLIYQTKSEDTGYPGVAFDAAADGGAPRRSGRLEFLAFWCHTVRKCGRFRLIYRPANPYSLAEFDGICRLAHACGDLTIVCEEIMTYLGSYDPRKSGVEGVTSLLTAGATAGIQCYLVTQKPTAIDHTITSQARQAYLFATHEASHVQYIRQTFGEDAAAKVQALQQYEYVRWDDTGPQRIVEVQKV